MTIAQRAAYAICTLYMMLILLRWFAGWLELDLHNVRWRWLPRLTDPLINFIRRILPPLGPMDLGPAATLVIVWLVREVAVVLLRSANVTYG